MRLATFSRVCEAKGIGDAVASVIRTNSKLGYNAFALDIYGQVEEGQEDWFASLMKGIPSYISYKGVVPFSSSVPIIKPYYALLFPTFYPGEGFAGTLIDSFSSGVPVIASDWRYNGEIVNDKVGILYPARDKGALAKILLGLANDPLALLGLKRNCLEEAKRYRPSEAIKVLIDGLG